MKNVKLIKLLQIMSRQELDLCLGYLRLFHSQKKITLSILSFIQPYHPTFDDPKLSKKLWQKETIGKDTNSKNFSNELSKTKSLVEEFLCIQQLRKVSKIDKEQILIKVYESYQQHETVLDLLQKLNEKLEKDHQQQTTNMLTSSHFLTHMQVKEKLYFDKSTNYYRVSKENYIIKASKQLYYFSTLNKLKYQCELMCRNKIMNESNLISFEDINDIKTFPLIIEIYYLIGKSLYTQEQNDYIKAENHFFKYQKILNTTDQNMCFTFLANFLSFKMRTDKEQYYSKILLNLYQKGLSKDIFIDRGEIDPTTFSNIVSLFAALQEFKLAEEFIDQYAQYLVEDRKTGIVNNNKASLYFWQHEYDAAIQILSNETAYFLLEKLRAKAVLLCCYFEMSQTNKTSIDLEQKINNFSRLLTRKKKELNPDLVKALRSFVIIFKDLYFQETEKEKIKEKFKTSKNIYMQTWLKTKVHNYTKKY